LLARPSSAEASHYLVYLSGISAISGDFLEPTEIELCDELAARFPGTAVVKDVLPYAVNYLAIGPVKNSQVSCEGYHPNYTLSIPCGELFSRVQSGIVKLGGIAIWEAHLHLETTRVSSPRILVSPWC
jgi:hypothetical protein